MEDLSVVVSASSTIEAQLIVGMLGSNGIDSIVSADDAGGLEPQFQLTAGVRVLVRREDEHEALRLIAEARGEQPPAV